MPVDTGTVLLDRDLNDKVPVTFDLVFIFLVISRLCVVRSDRKYFPNMRPRC